jgi:hypothetical protein
MRGSLIAIRTSETSVYFSDSTLRHIAEGCYLHTCRRENLKSHKKHPIIGPFNIFHHGVGSTFGCNVTLIW